MSRDAKILVLAHLPPPVHGASVMSAVATQALAARYRVEALRISTSDSIEGLGDASLAKIGRFARLAWSVLRASLRQRPDAVYVTLSPTTAAFFKDAILLLLARPFSRVAVIHLHGKGVRIAADRSRIVAAMYRIVFNRGLVVHLAECLLPDVAWTGCRTAVLNNGIDVPSLPERVRDVDVLFLSNLLETKGIFVLAEALRELGLKGRRVRAVFCGKFISAEDRRSLRAALAALPESVHVELREGAFGADKFELLARSRIFVLPTFYPNECFPLSIVEAMGAGLAIVSTDEGAISEIVAGNDAGVIVRSRDAAALAAALGGLLDDADAVARFADNAQRAYQARYTEDAFRRGLVDIVERELNHRGATVRRAA